jgi:hypothetical protein
MLGWWKMRKIFNLDEDAGLQPAFIDVIARIIMIACQSQIIELNLRKRESPERTIYQFQP